ncbi:hypothetical protein LCGC14_1124000 [marine sediment metagenome]|uniref:Uncharacterized protein n=1 Tax=marine sediment metagenome TaxID=412755 RepID=A0A0F9Q912_9ZZZZ
MLLQLLNILIVPLGAVMWFWGGCGSQCHPGLPPLNKSWRRHVWPVLIGITLYLNGITWQDSAFVGGLAVLANSLGYGHSKGWLQRILVAALLGAPFLVLNLTPLYVLATMLTFIPLYLLSRRYNWMTWGVVEAAVGATQGALVMTAIMGYHLAIVFKLIGMTG